MELKHRCKGLWLQLQELQTEVRSVQSSSTALDELVTTSDKPGAMPLLMELNRNFMNISLEAKNHVLENSEVFERLDDASVTEMLNFELTSEVDYLSQTECLLRSQRSELDEEVTRLKELKMHFLKLKGSLEDKLKVMSSGDVSVGQDFVKLQRENSRLKSVADVRLRQMKDFLNEHFPLPTGNQVEAWSKSNDSSSKRLPRKLLSLTEIVEQLMKRSDESPEDPYVVLSDLFWPPYVEMLLRSGIISRHPEISENIRLTLYHL